uniref:NADH-ubiquinone oxidoreductase chain 1 n=1 Tax=Gefionella okellyi TaxID=2853422 RepID=A0A0B5H2U6_9EUKA|nr:NADH dehydrogenase subunit 1 [Gefionella okellyi]
MLIRIIYQLLNILIIIIPFLLGIAYLTLAERKILSSIQRRRGPNIVGIYGLLQPLADGLKLLLKESIIPYKSNTILFIIAPIITFSLSLMGWAIIPFSLNTIFSNLNLGILYIFAISGLMVYGIIIAGWASNSKYAFLGSIRSAAQMISYEFPIGFIILNVFLLSKSLNLADIIIAQKHIWFVFPLFPLFLVFFIAVLAETNRPPFDLPEAEAELVSGYNVEYSAMGFALFFLGENGNIIFMSTLTTILFFGGGLPLYNIWFFNIIPYEIWFILKILFFIYLFILIRATYPRYRYDQLMALGLKTILPFSIAYFMFLLSLLIIYDLC